MTVKVAVPGSTSNLGAGFDFLGLALDLWLEVEVRDAGPSSYAGTLEDLNPETDLMLKVLRSQGITAVALRAVSDIPVGKGLGSSAAALTAAFAIAAMMKQEEPTPDELYSTVLQAEGHPDNAGPAVYGGLVAAFSGPTRLDICPALRVVLAVPDFTNSTAESRSQLPDSIPAPASIRQARRAAALVQGLVTGDAELVRLGMEDEIGAPLRSQLIPGYRDAVLAGQKAGALGVTISGAGPALLAITHEETQSEVRDALLETLNTSSRGWMGMVPEISVEGIRLTGRP